MKSVVIGLFADRMDVLVRQGDRVIDARRLPMTLGCDPQSWGAAVRASGEKLRNAVEDLRAAGADAVVLYRSATACSDCTSLAIRSPAEARQSAILSCAESLTCTLDQAVCGAALIGRDQSGNESKSHVVVAADHEEVIDAIACLVESAGLHFVAATPVEALSIAQATADALRQGKQTNVGSFHVGENRSFFIVADRGTLLFARPIGLGVEAFVTSLTRPIRSVSGAQPIELQPQAAREILSQFGFPDRQQIVYPPHELTGAQIIPLLQPVLQRFIVELRQSLRFGVPEDKRQSLSLVLAGPGSAIPNFAALIGMELKLEVSADERYARYDFQKPDSPGSELVNAAATEASYRSLGLQPRRISQARRASRLRRWLYAGAAAALLAVGLDFVQYHQQVNSAQRQVDALASQSGDMQELRTNGEKLLAAIAAANRLEAAIASQTSAAVDVRACLQEFSRITPDSVRLASIHFYRHKDSIVGELEGRAFDTGSDGSRLEPYIAQLKASPLFDQVVLSNVRASGSGAQSGQQFDISLVGVPVPRDLRVQAIAGVSGSAAP